MEGCQNGGDAYQQAKLSEALTKTFITRKQTTLQHGKHKLQLCYCQKELTLSLCGPHYLTNSNCLQKYTSSTSILKGFLLLMETSKRCKHTDIWTDIFQTSMTNSCRNMHWTDDLLALKTIVYN